MMKEGKRCGLQFSLRSLMVVVLVVAAFFAGRSSMRGKLDAMRAEAERQSAAAASHQRAAADAMYRLHVQLAERALTSPAPDTVREELLERAIDHQRSLINGDSDDTM